MSSTLAALSSAAAAAAASSAAVTVQELLQRACKEPNLEEKRRIYEQAYTMVRSDAELVGVLQGYAKETCYSQAIGGYKGSAHLQLFAIRLLLQESPNWRTHRTITDLLSECERTFNLDVLDSDPAALCQKATDQKALITSFIQLAFSLQNLDPYNKDVALQQKLNILIEALIGSDTVEQKRELVEFQYNRRCYLITLKEPNNYQAQYDCYDAILALLKECYAEDASERIGFESQILNMRGLITWKWYKTLPYAFSLVDPYFQQARDKRQQLVDRFAGDKVQQLGHQRLLKNIVYTQLYLNVIRPEKDKAKIAEQKKWLEDFIAAAKDRKDFHECDEDDEALLQKATAALQ